ncbi:MAG: stage III sporulation protein AF [Lachnospiraceae bacterium]|nr:stage III sporulation protein AF [Lachnospiraceae bacterium]
MLDSFYQWVKSIAACLIFMSLILRLLPEGKNEKYIRHFMGMILLLVVLAPLGKLFHLEEAFSRMELGFERSGARKEFEDELYLMGESYADEVVQGYEEELAAQALKFLKGEGYDGISVRVRIDSDQSSETFGQVMEIGVIPFSSEEEEETGKIVIEKKKVQILSEDSAPKSYLEEAEDNQLKKLLAGEFSIKEESVVIVR